jgi:hypothetical protein
MAPQLKTKQLNSPFMTEVRVFTQFCLQLVALTDCEISFPHNELAEQTRNVSSTAAETGLFVQITCCYRSGWHQRDM